MDKNQNTVPAGAELHRRNPSLRRTHDLLHAHFTRTVGDAEESSNRVLFYDTKDIPTFFCIGERTFIFLCELLPQDRVDAGKKRRGN